MTNDINNNDLEAPMIEKILVTDGYNSDGPSEKQDEPECPLGKDTQSRLNTLAFGTGTFVGLLSQILIEATVWDKALLSNSTQYLVWFSIGWSLATSITVHCAMELFLRDVRASYRPRHCTIQAWVPLSNRMEWYGVGGAVVSISGFWIVVDLATATLPLLMIWVADTLMVATTIYVMFFSCTMPRSGEGSSSLFFSSGNLLASIWGLAVGFGSQVGLSALTWMDRIPNPAAGGLFYFSIMWAAFTVVLTFSGSTCLRRGHRYLFGATDGSPFQTERTYLRMESFYVLSSLIGICFAWITFDAMLGLNKQVMPSLIMLAVSLLIFRAILYCFPEDRCAKELTQGVKNLEQEEEELALLAEEQATPDISGAVLQ